MGLQFLWFYELFGLLVIVRLYMLKQSKTSESVQKILYFKGVDGMDS